MQVEIPLQLRCRVVVVELGLPFFLGLAPLAVPVASSDAVSLS